MNVNSSDVINRLGLLCGGALLMRASYSLILGEAPLITHPGFAIAIVIYSFVALCLIGAAGLGRVPAGVRWMVLAAVLGELGLRSVVHLTTTEATASQALVDFAAGLLRSGINPYTWDYTGVFALYDAPPLVTATGDILANYPYPPLSFLLALPTGAYTAAVLLYAVVVVRIFFATPKPYQPLVLVPLIAADSFLFSLLAQSHPVHVMWVALVVLAIGLSTWWQSFLLAAALSVHPLAWLAVPFAAADAWHQKRLGQFVRMGTVTVTFINLPFILSSPSAWARSLTAPAIHHLPLNLSPTFSGAVLLLSVAIGMWFYVRHRATMHGGQWGILAFGTLLSGIAAPVISFLWLLPALVQLWQPRPAPKATYQWRHSLQHAVGATLTIMLVGFSSGIFINAAPLEVTILRPLRVDTDGRIIEVPVQVTNKSSTTLTPEFLLNPEFTTHYDAWIADSPNTHLQPNASHTYTLRPQPGADGFYVGARVVAVANNQRSQPQFTGYYDTYPFPDVIDNPAFDLWYEGTPLDWHVDMQPRGQGDISVEPIAGRNALVMTMPAATANLNRMSVQKQTIFPRTPFALWVYPPPQTNLIYALEIDDGSHRLIYRFSPQSADPAGNATTHIETITAPAGEWHRVEFDLMAKYAELGWELPPLQRTIYRELDLDLRMVSLQLSLTTATHTEPVQAVFGGFEQSTRVIPPNQLMQESLNHPVDYYMRLAERHTAAQNYERAIVAYQRALDHDPDQTDMILAKIESLQDQIYVSWHQP